ncbi:hypothetical protein C8R32_10483 [Nitrosospira sp. Nsp5]|uniref:Uncharacterized protein n=1 Tax=Nitrosospira multiformis TaxID=1231 RepID=A0ABY0TG06_9PROT|nr:hypothetical protein C8R32_10483 [Nitrosospira sp. Nsp5]SDQ68808.1 hypothetical protein SAMN05216402_1862 [Nitrosospira multiformis]
MVYQQALVTAGEHGVEKSSVTPEEIAPILCHNVAALLCGKYSGLCFVPTILHKTVFATQG